MPSVVDNAELALLLEVSGTPTPGNVDRERDLDELSYEHFLAGAVGAQGGFATAVETNDFGSGFERAIAGMTDYTNTNTQFGAILLLMPLVQTASTGALTPSRANTTVEKAGVEGATGFYAAFDHVDVNIPDPPEDIPDANKGSEAIDEIRSRGLTLVDVLEPSTDRNGISYELLHGFSRTFMAADWLAETTQAQSLSKRTATVHLQLLAEIPDTLVAVAHGEETAHQVKQRAAELLPDSPGDTIDFASVRTFAGELTERQINPGMTADLLAGGLFIALERGDINI